MADMYGTLCSNSFKVKNIAAFTVWFGAYHFGEDVTLHVIDEASREVFFAGHEQYPSSYPRQYDEEEEEYEEVNLHQFASELAIHLEDGEVLQVVSGGNEKLRYVSYDQLIIAAAHPEHPVYEVVTSGEDNAILLAKVESYMQQDLAAS